MRSAFSMQAGPRYLHAVTSVEDDRGESALSISSRLAAVLCDEEEEEQEANERLQLASKRSVSRLLTSSVFLAACYYDTT